VTTLSLDQLTRFSLDDTNPHADAVVLIRDVTDRPKTEQDLRDAQEELVRLAHADEALYKTKHSGRNAVCCADVSTSG
jgi:GGDEF domain-containing protein